MENNTNFDKKKAFVELKFGPNWEYISTVRSFLVNFLAIALEEKKKADRIAMSVNELVENAIKYSDRDGIEIIINVYTNKEINISVTNHTTREAIHILKGIVTEIYKNSPLEAYIQRMKKSAEGIEDETGIGIARIRYETGADIKVSTKNNFVTVTAEFLDKGNFNDNE